jgi:hypothetical protein
MAGVVGPSCSSPPGLSKETNTGGHDVTACKFLFSDISQIEINISGISYIFVSPKMQIVETTPESASSE